MSTDRRSVRPEPTTVHASEQERRTAERRGPSERSREDRGGGRGAGVTHGVEPWRNSSYCTESERMARWPVG